jgi:hypothetical protein
VSYLWPSTQPTALKATVNNNAIVPRRMRKPLNLILD